MLVLFDLCSLVICLYLLPNYKKWFSVCEMLF